MIHENRGGVASSYISDPLGNTIGLLDMNGNQTDSWTYWPYGEVQNHTGSSATPFTFLGTLGYFVDFLNMLYVRARHLKADLTTWMTVDPIWPKQRQYLFVGSSPVMEADSWGLLSFSELQGLLEACGSALFGVIVEILTSIAHGEFPPSLNTLCKAGGACLGALIATIISIYLESLASLGDCLGGAAGGIVGNIVQVLCDHLPTQCIVLTSILAAASGCIGGIIGNPSPDNSPVGTVGVGVDFFHSGFFSWLNLIFPGCDPAPENPCGGKA